MGMTETMRLRLRVIILPETSMLSSGERHHLESLLLVLIADLQP